ncbi:MAG: hypothetical protein ACLUB2_03620 [Butyricicoccus pullicaecorum]
MSIGACAGFMVGMNDSSSWHSLPFVAGVIAALIYCPNHFPKIRTYPSTLTIFGIGLDFIGIYM